MYTKVSAMVYYTLHINKLLIVSLLSILSTGVIYSGNLSKDFINSYYSFDEPLDLESPLLRSPFTPKNLYASFGDSYSTDNTADIKEINIGLGVRNIFKRWPIGLRKGSAEFRFFALGFTHKNYYDVTKKDQVGFNAVLMKYRGINHPMRFDDKFKALVGELGLTIIEKKSPIYAKNDVDWISISLGLGYDPLFYTLNTSVIILPRVGIGLRTLSLDTNLFLGLPTPHKNKTYYGLGNAAIRFIASHKSLTAYAEAGLFHFNSLAFYSYAAGISYTFLKKHYAYSHDVITIFLNLEANKFSISDDSGTYSKTIQNIRGGLSFRLAAFFDTAF